MAGVRQMLTRHWRSKLFSLFLATAAWFGVVGRDIQSKRDVEVAIHIQRLEKVAFLPLKTKTIKADFRGPSGKLNKIGDRLEAHINLKGKLDVASIPEGQPKYLDINIATEHFELPSEVELLRAHPATIMVGCERETERAIEVRAKFCFTKDGETKEVKPGQSTRGIVGEGFEINWPLTYCRPPTVPVAGPQTVISKMQYIETKPVDITGFKAPAFPTVALVDTFNDPDLGGEVQIVPRGQVSLFISVDPERRTRKLEKVPISFIRPKLYPFAVSVLDQNRNEIKEVDLTVIGPADVVEKMTPKDANVLVAADLRGIVEAGPPREMPLTISLPDKVRLEPERPPVVTVVVSPIEKPAGP
jgi:hypothetical protein